MLFAHAFAYALGRKYGGACGSSPYADDYRRLIHLLGLQDELIYNPHTCPRKRRSRHNNNNNNNSNVHSMMLPKDVYRDWKNSRIFTEKWICHMQQKRRTASSVRVADSGLTTTSEERMQLLFQQDITNKTIAKKPKHIVVHIRRGDITPCSEVVRYLPNIHYLRLLDRVADSSSNNNDTRVTIFTEHPEVDCSEDFQPFLDRGMTLLEGNTAALSSINQLKEQQPAPKIILVNVDIEFVWRTILFDADVLILSKLAFSYLPALFTKARTVVFSKFFFLPLPHWQMTPREIIMESNRARERLKSKCCQNHTRRRAKPKLKDREVT